MQLQNTQSQYFKSFRSRVPTRNWCLDVNCCEESYWTLERCVQDARNYPTRELWERESPISYRKAIKRGWLTKCTLHIKGFRRKASVPAVWTLERCKVVARQCASRKEFKRKFNYPYEKARQMGWLEHCCAHMR